MTIVLDGQNPTVRKLVQVACEGEFSEVVLSDELEVG
jgi:hypothetical protein